MTHTKEPWHIVCHTCASPAEIGEGDDYTIKGIDGTQVAFEPCRADPNRGADARRIVACVNACAGISMELLENERFAALIAAAEREECAALIPPQYFELRDRMRARGNDD